VGKRLTFAFRVAISLLLVVLLLVYAVDLPQVWRILRGLRPTYLLLAVAAIILDRALMTYKWTLLLGAQGYRLALLRGMVIYCAAMLWGSVLPGTVGADAIRAVLVMRRGIRGADAVASIIVERLVGFLAALLLGIASLVILRSSGVLDARYDRAFYLGAAVIAGTLGLIWLSLSASLTGVAMKLLPVPVRDSKLMARLTRMTDAYRSLGAARSTIATFAGLTLLEQMFVVAVPWILAMGLGIPVNALVLLGVFPLAMLISRLPISVDGLGVFEAVFVGLLLLARVPAEASLAIAISGRVIQLLCFLPWWLVQVAGSGGLRPPEPASS
jgi:glycosyltransferase 2 family protein